MNCECCGKPLDVQAVWPDGSITPTDEQTRQRYLALYGEPTSFKFERHPDISRSSNAD